MSVFGRDSSLMCKRVILQMCEGGLITMPNKQTSNIWNKGKDNKGVVVLFCFVFVFYPKLEACVVKWKHMFIAVAVIYLKSLSSPTRSLILKLIKK